MSKKLKQAQEKHLAKATAALVRAPPSLTKTDESTNASRTPVSNNSLQGCNGTPYKIRKIKKSRKHNANSGFFSQHPHVRARIYAFVMADHTHADLEPTGLQHPAHLTNGYRIPPIMKVCSAIRLEASRVFYSKTTFVYRQEQVLFGWLRLIGPSNRRFVRTVRRDHIFLSKAWAEAAIVFTHARLKDNCIDGLAEDAVEVAYWQKPGGTEDVSGKERWVLIRGEKWFVEEEEVVRPRVVEESVVEESVMDSIVEDSVVDEEAVEGQIAEEL